LPPAHFKNGFAPTLYGLNKSCTTDSIVSEVKYFVSIAIILFEYPNLQKYILYYFTLSDIVVLFSITAKVGSIKSWRLRAISYQVTKKLKWATILE
jgi:hypothetical protein